MRQVIRYGVIAAALLLPRIAHAQDWRLTSMEENRESVFFLDADSIRKTGGNATGDIFLVLSEPEKGMSGIQADLEYECASGRRRYRSLRAYDAREQVQRTFESVGEWEETERNTQFSVLWDMMCGTIPLTERSYGAEPPFAAAREIRARHD